ncbi:MAG: hypothetical protein D4R94_03930 [Chitinophagaceae bacterium]|nr:MAG: hypothetical protein D4R94_03930 [Chitinophagaceae bacterium]
MGKLPQHWIKISLINLLIVAFVGVILRYKIAFALPLIDQKHLLHGYSHFAFAGWINQTIMVLMLMAISNQQENTLLKKYKVLIYINLLTAYGMLISFAISGYALFSISFSTLSIINSYIFGIFIWKEMNKLNKKLTSYWWYKAAILFNIISSLGSFTLSFLMASSSVNQNYYLLAVYAFLHFQYNGWFFFACMGLLITQIEKIGTVDKKLKIIFWLFSIACIPAYYLPVLWLSIPLMGYVIIVLAAAAQWIGWGMLLVIICKNHAQFLRLFHKKGRWLVYLSGIALSIKLLLQLISTIPSLSHLAFGFRPVVIGYLHLMLLGVISLFLLGYIFANQLIKIGYYAKMGSIVFIIGIVVNQILLLVQGASAMNYIGIPFINESLFIVALIIFIGLFLINIQRELNYKN